MSSADGDLDVDHELWLEFEDVTAKMFKQSCKVHIFIVDETIIVVLYSLADL